MNTVDPKRSAQMRLIKSRNTKPEMKVRKTLHAQGLRYRLHAKELPGKPDLVFPSRKIAVFVHGCFWHRHKGCANARMPKSGLDYWETKLSRNVERVHLQKAQLRKTGWRVLVIWECETRKGQALIKLARRILAAPAKSPKSTGAVKR